MSVVDRLSAEQAAVAEREYVELRGPVQGMLRREFPRLRRELDDLYHQAWIEYLELRASGVAIDNPRALLQKIAWRAARARVRKAKPDLLEPSSHVLTDAADRDPLPDEHAQVRIDAEALRVVAESLDRNQAAALKLRFDYGLSAREIQQVLGVSPKRLEKIMTKAYAQMAEQLAVPPSGETLWLRRQRSLLLLCEAGLASSRQVRRARRIVEAHPRCRAMLAEMRAALHDTAAILPAPILVESEDHFRRAQLVLDRLSEAWAGTKQLGWELTNRGAPASLAADQAGAGGALIGTGAAAKIAAFCLMAGGTAVVCLQGTKLVEHHRPAVRKHHAHRSPQARTRTIESVEPTAFVRTQPASAPKASTDHRVKTPVSSPGSRAPATPVPSGSQEFGPGAIGSSGTSAQAASAPTDGGGEFTP